MPEVKEKEQTQEKASQQEAQQAPAPSKGGKVTSSLIMLELLSIALAFIVVNHVLKPRVPEWAKPENKPVEDLSKPGVIVTVPDLVINPAGSQGTRYLSASIGIEVADEEARQHIESRSIVVRDALIGILSAETVEQLSSPNERTYLRKLILQELNKLLKPVVVRNVYFIDYVLQ